MLAQCVPDNVDKILLQCEAESRRQEAELYK